MAQDHLPGISEIGDVISISACIKSAKRNTCLCTCLDGKAAHL